MKRTLFLIYSAILCLCIGCDFGDATAYKDLVFGMSLEEVKAKGYCTGEKTFSEEGMETYQCRYSDFAGCNSDKAELCFSNNKLAKVHFYNSTFDAIEQRNISKYYCPLNFFEPATN